MTGLNVDWALMQLNEFAAATEMRNASSGSFFTNKDKTFANDSEVTRQAPVVEQILDRVIPDWRTSVPDTSANNRWSRHREATLRARQLLLRQQELEENLGDDAPRISAGELHLWVWESARSLWKDGHFKQAVQNALIQLNAEAQKKSGRTDISEHDLFKQLFSTDPPKPGAPRLQRSDRSDPKTFTSMQEGARALAEALYKGIRNPLNHRADHELSEQEALESLAAISTLARWVDDAELVTAEEGAGA